MLPVTPFFPKRKDQRYTNKPSEDVTYTKGSRFEDVALVEQVVIPERHAHRRGSLHVLPVVVVDRQSLKRVGGDPSKRILIKIPLSKDICRKVPGSSLKVVQRSRR